MRYFYWVVGRLNASWIATEVSLDDPITTGEQLSDIASHVKENLNVELGSCVVTNFTLLRTEVVQPS